MARSTPAVGARVSPGALAALLALGVLYATVLSADVMAHVQGDGHYTYLWARSLAFDGDLDLTNDYALCGDPWRMLTPKEPGLRPQNTWPVGPALLWSPALLAARALGVGGPPHGCFGARAEVAMAVTCLAGWLTVVLAFVVARRRVGEGPALLAALAVGLATALPYYTAILPSYSHAPSAFAVALFLERWDATRGAVTWRRWLLLGVLLGVVVLMRPQDAVVVLAPLGEWLALAATAVRLRRAGDALRLVGRGVLFVSVAALVFSPQMVAWKRSYGAWLAVPQGPFYMRWEHPFVDGFLFGSSNGLLSWTPVLYLAFVGLALGTAKRATRGLALPLALMVAASVYVNAAVWDYWGAVGFAGRRITDMSLPFALGIALTLERLFAWAERRPRAFAGLATAAAFALAAAWNGAAMKGVATFKLETYREAPMPTFWRTTFDILVDAVYPRLGNPFALPGSAPLAWRYGTTPDRFDVLRGMGIFYQEFQTRDVRLIEATADLTGARGDMYCAEGFATESLRVRGTLARATTARRARMLLPFFADDVGTVTLTWSDGATPTARALGIRSLGAVPQLAGTRPGATPGGSTDAGVPTDLPAAPLPAPLAPSGPPTTPVAPAVAPVPRVRIVWNGVDVGRYDPPAGSFGPTRISLPRGVVRVGVNEGVLEIDGAPVFVEKLLAER
jgi:hypothetical protein